MLEIICMIVRIVPQPYSMGEYNFEYKQMHHVSFAYSSHFFRKLHPYYLGTLETFQRCSKYPLDKCEKRAHKLINYLDFCSMIQKKEERKIKIHYRYQIDYLTDTSMQNIHGITLSSVRNYEAVIIY